MQVGWYCRFYLGPVVGRRRDCCQRHAVYYRRLLIFTQISQLYVSSVVLLHQGDKMKLFFFFFFCICNGISEARGKGKSTTTLYVLVEDLLPPTKMSAIFNREAILEVVAVSSTVPGEAQSHPCKAFPSVLSSARKAASRINHTPTLNVNSVAEGLD